MNVYEYCGNGPVAMSDASGLASLHPGDGVGLACGIKALLSLIGSSEGFHSGFDWNALLAAICSVIMNCGAGALCKALSNLADFSSPMTGCMVGAICSVSVNILTDLCTLFTDCPGHDNVPKMLCNMVSSAISGCAGGLLPDIPGIGGGASAIGSLACNYLYGGHHTWVH